MKRSYLTLAVVGLLSGVVALSSCSKKTEGCTDPTATNYDPEADKDNGSCQYDTATNAVDTVLSGTLSASDTLTADHIWILDGRVVVSEGVTLTIEAGTIVKGKTGTGTDASALIIAKGGKIMAVGTANDPIIFTSELDNIKMGEKVGTNLTKTDNEKWGGIILLGKAPVSAENGDTQGNIEGIPANLGYGAYGGSDVNDNSGTMSYVSIRHGGVTIGEGNEINGLTFGGVGAGTTINNVEIYATLDDGMEFFGGTVDLTDVLIFFQGDDGLDVDQNYAGIIDGFAVVHGDGIGTDEGLEIDGPENTTNKDGQFTIKNGVCKYLDATGTGSAADFKSDAQGFVQNVTFDYSALGGKPVKFRTKFDGACNNKEDAYTHLVSPSNAQTLSLTGCSIDGGTTVYDGDNDPSLCPTELDADKVAAAAAVTAGSGSTYNYASKFSWGAAGSRGEL